MTWRIEKRVDAGEILSAIALLTTILGATYLLSGDVSAVTTQVDQHERRFDLTDQRLSRMEERAQRRHEESMQELREIRRQISSD